MKKQPNLTTSPPSAGVAEKLALSSARTSQLSGWEFPSLDVPAGPTNRKAKRKRCKMRRRARLALRDGRGGSDPLAARLTLDKIFRRVDAIEKRRARGEVDAIEPCTGPVEVVAEPRPKLHLARWSAFEGSARAEQTDHLRKLLAAHEKEKRAARGEVDESAEFEAMRVRVRELIAAWRERDGAEVEP